MAYSVSRQPHGRAVDGQRMRAHVEPQTAGGEHRGVRARRGAQLPTTTRASSSRRTNSFVT